MQQRIALSIGKQLVLYMTETGYFKMYLWDPPCQRSQDKSTIPANRSEPSLSAHKVISYFRFTIFWCLAKASIKLCDFILWYWFKLFHVSRRQLFIFKAQFVSVTFTMWTYAECHIMRKRAFRQCRQWKIVLRFSQTVKDLSYYIVFKNNSLSLTF